jgi:hypothetical protein
VVRGALRPSDLVEFVRFDAGEVLRKDMTVGLDNRIEGKNMANPILVTGAAGTKRPPHFSSAIPTTISFPRETKYGVG